MPHFNLVNTHDVMDGPVDYSAPVGTAALFVCSTTVRDHIERRKPVTKRFTSNDAHDSFWLKKFRIHTETNPDAVTYAKNKKGVWYVQALYL